MLRSALFVTLALLAAGCGSPEPPGVSTTHPPASVNQPETPTATSPPTPTAPRPTAFGPGIYYRDPTDGGSLADPARAFDASLPPGGFDLRANRLVYALDRNVLALVTPTGGRTTLHAGSLDVPLNHVARPSFSPDGTRVVVQATLGEPADAPPANLNIYVIDLETGAATTIASAPHNEESPEWFPTGDRIAFSSFSPELGVVLHVVDVATGEEKLVVDDGGAIHLAISPDGARILDPGRARVLDAQTGDVVADLREAIVSGLEAAGFGVDTRYPGQANRGTFPLDGAFSPDGARLVFDGAVEKDGALGVLVFTVAIDGSDLEVVAGPFAVDPATTNGLNYSETNPTWL